jgi:cytochrome c-type biogenesis protein CcmH
MSGFVLGAVVLALVAASFIAVPLLRPVAQLRRGTLSAAIGVLLLLAGSGGIYLARSNWSWKSAPAAAQSNLSELVSRASREPGNHDAWLELGQAYSQAGQFALALHAYDRANALSGGNDPAALAGMGEAMLRSDDESQAVTARSLLERALAADPHSPKALFYTAVLAMNAGDLELARSRFNAMLETNPPGQVRTALAEQIAAIDRMLHPPVDRATLIDLQIDVAPAVRARLPSGGALFVFARNPQGGAPLAARRLTAALPAHVQLSAADSLGGPAAMSAGQAVLVVARLSAAGQATAKGGDLYGELQYRAGKDGSRRLVIDRVTQ